MSSVRPNSRCVCNESSRSNVMIFNPDRNVFLNLTKCFSCLNLTKLRLYDKDNHTRGIIAKKCVNTSRYIDISIFHFLMSVSASAPRIQYQSGS